MHRTTRGNSVRTGRTAVVLVALVAMAATGPATAAGPAPPGDEGSTLRSGGGVLGTVSTQVISVVPLVGDVALPVKLGTAGAQADGEVRRASSQVADLGLLGTLGILAITGAPTLTRLGVPVSQFAGALKLPPATVADSRTTASAEGRPVFPEVPIGPATLGGGHQEARATDGAAFGRTELGDATLDLGAVQIQLNGGVAETIADATHVAATSTVGEMRFLAGATEIGSLQGLVWRFEQTLDQPPTSTFELGSGRMGSFGLPVPAPAEGADLAAALTQALAPLGVRLSLPQPRPGGGLTPMRIALDDASVAAQLVRPVYSQALADAVNDAQGAIVAGVPETGLALTVANVVLGAATGQGGAAVELGGITGSMGRRPAEEYSYGDDPAPALAEPPAASPDLSESAMPTPPGATPAPSAQPSAVTESEPAVLSQLVSAVVGESLPAALVVLGGLGATVALAAIDRRRIASIAAGRGLR